MKTQDRFFSTKRYQRQGAIHIGTAVLVFLLFLLGGTLRDSMAFAFGFGGLCGGIILAFGIYNEVCAVRYDTMARTASHFRGTVSNWELSYAKGMARICVNHEGNEYASASYFGHAEAKELVGREIAFCIIEDTLFITQLIATSEEN